MAKKNAAGGLSPKPSPRTERENTDLEEAEAAPTTKSPVVQRKVVDEVVEDDKYAEKKHGVRRQPNPLHAIDWTLFGVITVLGLITRLFRLDNPHYVVFDEVHFGKFGSYYLRGEYYFDVHPPLGKLLVALSGWFAGYNGNYLFDKIGDDYLTISKQGPIPYVAMRLFPALMGAVQVPLSYLTVIELGGSNLAAAVASCLFLFDNAQVTQTRLILLDASLMLFIVWSLYAFAKFNNTAHEPFSLSWFFWLASTGFGLGCAVSVKFVGLFIIATVGLHTVYELWVLYSDRRNPLGYVWQHFQWRAVFLIVLPISIFIGCFWIHMAVLANSGPGDTHMSAAFQSGLIGNSLNAMTGKMPQNIAFGSKITFKNANSKPSCWLHSHWDRYPRYYGKGTSSERVSSAQQQVTCYPHNDQNNQFIIYPKDTQIPIIKYIETKPDPNATEPVEMPPIEIPSEVKYVKNADIVKLLHVSTKKLLNGHDVASANFPSKQEVSCWNASESLAGQTLWRVVFTAGDFLAPWKPYTTHIKLEHVTTNTVLELSGEELPEWGFKQLEVVSAKITRGSHETWFVDTIEDERLPSEEVERMPPMGFFPKLKELLSTMLESNAKLTSKHVYASRPEDWPFLTRGVSFYQSKDNTAQIYLLGNPVSWWGGHVFLFLFMGIFLFFVMREARGFIDFNEHNRMRLQQGMGLAVLAWALHYFPFYSMDRQLFLHHYLPAVYFVFLAAGLFVEIILSKFPEPLKIVVAASIIGAAAVVFYMMAPMSYSLDYNGWEPALKLRKAWDFKTFQKTS